MKKFIFLFILLLPLLLFSQERGTEGNFTYTGCGCKNAIELTIYNGLYKDDTGDFGGQSIKNKTTRGAVTVANKNDSDSDGITDNIDNSVLQTSHGVNEIDLMKLEIKWTGPKPIPPTCTELELKTIGNIELWEKNSKEIIAKRKIPISALPLTIYIEAKDVSTKIRDISIQAFLDGVLHDEVKATAIWCDFKKKYLTRATSGSDNPSPASLGIDEIPLSYAIDQQFVAKDGSFYGIGTNSLFQPSIYLLKHPAGSICNLNLYTGLDGGFGGRILHEFILLPNGIENNLFSLGIKYDIGRQIKKTESSMAFAGNAKWKVYNVTFPIEDEMATDDTDENDEDNVPKNKEIFSYDNPSNNYVTNTYFMPDKSYLKREMEFKEFVRVSFGNNIPNGNNKTRGSRSSDKIPWELRYAVRNELLEGTTPNNQYNGCEHYFAELTTNPSVSQPINIAFSIPLGGPIPPIAKGNIKISLLANPITQNYVLEYDSSGWKLYSYSTNGKVLINNIATISGKLVDSNKLEVDIVNNTSFPFIEGSIYYFTSLNEPSINNSYIK
jgi:hypothetical protein